MLKKEIPRKASIGTIGKRVLPCSRAANLFHEKRWKQNGRLMTLNVKIDFLFIFLNLFSRETSID